MNDPNGNDSMGTEVEMVAKLLTDKQALEDFVVDNKELEQLESQLDQFNIFEAIKVVRQELRHSDFLGFLLDPQQPHGLSDTFLKKLLQKALLAVRGDASSLPVSLIDLDVWNLTDSLVLREWSNIDILLVNATHKLVVVIENKVDSGEHSGQLNRYLTIVNHHYSDYKVLPLFLTRQGQLPTDERYISVSYVLVVTLLESILASRSEARHDDVTTLIRHYVSMVRRHIVNQNEINDLAHRIYLKHKRAIDLIIEQKPDNQVAIIDRLMLHISKAPDFEVDSRSPRSVTFTVPAWDVLLPPDPAITNWSAKGRISRFEFQYDYETLRIYLVIGPGDAKVRLQMFTVAQMNRPPFTAGNKFTGVYSRIYNKVFLAKGDWQDADPDEIQNIVDKKWQAFLDETWPMFNKYVTTGLTMPAQVP